MFIECCVFCMLLNCLSPRSSQRLVLGFVRTGLFWFWPYFCDVVLILRMWAFFGLILKFQVVHKALLTLLAPKLQPLFPQRCTSSETSA